MREQNKIPASDAEWYCRRDDEANRFYDIFFGICKKYHINWESAPVKEKAFTEEAVRVTYERDRANRLGLSPSSVRDAFTF